MSFILRDTVSGDLLGEPFDGAFVWHGTTDRCAMIAQDGLEYVLGATVLQRVYEIAEKRKGAGSVAVAGEPIYNNKTDTVSRHTIYSRSQLDLAVDATAWARTRANGYVAAIAGVKGFPPELADKVTVIGFVLDAIITEMAARGASETQEFADIIAAIAAVKLSIPKP